MSMIDMPAWEPGALERDWARLKRQEERIRDLAVRWELDGGDAAVAAAELLDVLDDDSEQP